MTEPTDPPILIVPPPAGQVCTGTGELPRLVQRNTTTGPLFVLFSKWR